MQAGQDAPPTHQPAGAVASSKAHSQPQELQAQERVMDREINQSIAYLRDYSRKRPPQYEGKIVSLKAEEWLLQIEKVLDALRILDDGERARLATFFLTDSAYMWWLTERN